MAVNSVEEAKKVEEFGRILQNLSVFWESEMKRRNLELTSKEWDELTVLNLGYARSGLLVLDVAALRSRTPEEKLKDLVSL